MTESGPKVYDTPRSFSPHPCGQATAVSQGHSGAPQPHGIVRYGGADIWQAASVSQTSC